MAFALNFSNLPPVPGAAAAVAAALPPADDPSWSCPDCGLLIATAEVAGLEQANEHWRTCPSPGPEVLQRRERNGLVAGVVPVSPSALETWELCKRRSWFEKQDPDRVRTASGPLADLGTALHQALESGDDRPPVSLPMEFAADWPWMLRTLRRLIALDPLPEVPRGAFLEQVVNTSYRLEARDGVEACEVAFQGKIDRLYVYDDDSILIDDGKTGWSVPSELEDNTQGLCYLVAALLLFPFGRRFKFRQAQLRRNRIIDTPWYTQEQVYAMVEVLAAKVAAYARERLWPATPGAHCHHCDWAHKCKAGEQFLGEQGTNFKLLFRTHIGSEDDLRHAMLGMELAKAQLAKLEAAARAYVSRHGGMTLRDGRYIGRQEKTRQRITDKRGAWEALERADIDPLDYFLFDHRNRQLFDNLLAPFLTEERYQGDFGIHEVKKEVNP